MKTTTTITMIKAVFEMPALVEEEELLKASLLENDVLIAEEEKKDIGAMTIESVVEKEQMIRGRPKWWEMISTRHSRNNEL
jgi:hypothetical protein